jgi:hypothetical protein
MTATPLPATSAAPAIAAPVAPVESPRRGFVRTAWLLFLAGCFYFVCFVLLTAPLIASFSTRFFTDDGDGLQNVWNIWWVNKAMRLHQSFWHTNFLHYPQGTTLIGHTLCPFNGLTWTFVVPFFSLVQAHNFVVVFSFVTGGIGAMLLAHRFSKRWLPSLAGGFVFTFCNYHFAHAQGHLQMVSLEWLPFFLLAFYDLVHEPRLWRALLAALVLFLVILCDYYYFFFCVLAGVIVVVDLVIRRRSLRPLFEGRRLVSLGVFTLLVLATAGPIVWSLLQASRSERFMGAHAPATNSLDLLALLIPGGHWRFAKLTEWYWSQLGPKDQPNNPHEHSVAMGLSVLFLLIVAWWNRRRPLSADLKLLFGMMLFFFVMALGPDLRIWGWSAGLPYTPYRLLETVFPFLKISGCPVRMVVMVLLCASCIAAYGIKLIAESPGEGKRLLLAGVAILLFFEYLPDGIPSTSPRVPAYVRVLKNLPAEGCVLDRYEGSLSRCLYYQTVHEKPMPTLFGFIARMPRTAVQADRDIVDIARAGNFRELRGRYRVHYLVMPDQVEADGLKPVREVEGAWIYEILP